MACAVSRGDLSRGMANDRVWVDAPRFEQVDEDNLYCSDERLGQSRLTQVRSCSRLAQLTLRRTLATRSVTMGTGLPIRDHDGGSRLR